jgi:hypothetical protein
MTTTERSSRPDDHSRKRSLDSRIPGYRYGIVLILLVVTYVVAVAAPAGGWARLVTIALQALTLVVAMNASRASRGTIRITSIVMVVVTLGAVGAVPAGSGGAGLRGASFLVSATLAAAAPIVIVRGLVRRPLIDFHTVLGALCVYVLIGMLFAYVYAAIGTLGSGTFFAQDVHATISDYLYFSFVTLTTVGYGDLTAAGGLGRATAVLEALLGQIYLVTVVAVLVGAIGRRPRPARDPGVDATSLDGGEV